MSKAAVRSFLVVVFLVIVSACSGTSPEQDGSTPSVTANAAEPPTENTAVAEKPLPPQEGKPGIAVPSLPIGGSDNTGGPCVQVSWSGGEIPEGFGAQIEGVTFEGQAYRQTDSGCPGSACIGHIFRAAELQCDLAITPADASARGDIDGDEVSVFMTGRVLCPDYDAAECKAFEKVVRDQSPSMTVPRPPAQEAPPVSTDPGAGTSSTSDATSSTSDTSSSTATESPGG